MSSLSSLIVGSYDDWTKSLPGYQLRVLDELVSSGVPEDDLAQQWLSATYDSTTLPFGAGPGRSEYIERFWDEVHDLLCAESKYVDERAELTKSLGVGQASAVACVSAFLAHVLPVSAAAVAPPVAIVFFTIAKMGLNAWCRVQTQRRSERNSQPPVDAA
ncbi:hypothetical protein [Catellatospora sp. NPDC049133]|uniref:hypothetical protein n=1 Tax=Catellatospora sp. NPDC049133 TaxID=3155499 RepID=UPI0033F1247F